MLVEAHGMGGGVTAPLEALDAYVTGDMSDADALRFEEELFAAAEAGDAAEAAFVDQLTRHATFLAPRGGFDIGSTRAHVDSLIAAGLRVQLLAPVPGASVGGLHQLPQVDDDAEIVVTHLPIDVRGYDSVNVIIAKPDGTELKTFREIGWDPEDGSVYAVCEAHLARLSLAVGPVRSTVIGKRAGQDHVIAVFETESAP